MLIRSISTEAIVYAEIGKFKVDASGNLFEYDTDMSYHFCRSYNDMKKRISYDDISQIHLAGYTALGFKDPRE